MVKINPRSNLRYKLQQVSGKVKQLRNENKNWDMYLGIYLLWFDKDGYFYHFIVFNSKKDITRKIYST